MVQELFGLLNRKFASTRVPCGELVDQDALIRALAAKLMIPIVDVEYMRNEAIARLLMRHLVTQAEKGIGADISGARRNSVSGIGVLWGYGTREELEAAGAVVCVASAAELAAVVREHFPESEAIATWLPVA